ncbi:MAG: hypothetical protein IJU52_04540 [Clostridia bacterium]|nr:hypothetical protein [Clostridia bacterium]
MRKEKRYELYKRGELTGRDAPGVNALAEDSGTADDLLPNRSRGQTPSPRSSLNNALRGEILDRPGRKGTVGDAPDVYTGMPGRRMIEGEKKSRTK